MSMSEEQVREEQPEDEITSAEQATAESAVEPSEEAVTPRETLVLAPKPVPPAPEPKKVAKEKPTPEEASQSPFSITIGQVYDGPFDLLLDLIRKQNLDIYDIPMSKITAQFLEYTHHLREADVDVAGEFVYVASMLIHIKSKTLLPRDPMDVAAGTDEDPRRELVERLLEHERFKAAAQMLQQKQMLEDASWSKPGMRAFLREEGLDSPDGEREIAATTNDLLLVFRDILNRLRERPVHSINEDSVTVAQMIDFVKRRLLMEEKPISLRKMLNNVRSERALICTFLAMLELVRLQAMLLHQTEVFGDILLKKTEHFDQVFADQAAVRDDWG
jgi:segregation and condensation protein A